MKGRDFTKEEARDWENQLNKLYASTGSNFYEDLKQNPKGFIKYADKLKIPEKRRLEAHAIWREAQKQLREEINKENN